MDIPDNVKNEKLYQDVKKEIYKKYPKHSAYRSGLLVQEYKRRGGEYKGRKPTKKGDNLVRWFAEEWKDVGGKDYPTYRPTKRITKDTPLLASEIDDKDLQEKIIEKQKIKGTRNLSPFKKKGGRMNKINVLLEVSKKYDSQNKKYDAILDDGEKIKTVSFGDNRFQDFTMHRNEERKKLYIGRRSNMEKKYHNDPYKPAFWALHLLWNKPTISASIDDIEKNYPFLEINVN